MSQPLIEPRLLKGFRDTLPDKMAARQHMIRTVESVLQTFGFGPLETPALEYADILLGKLGQEGEKLLYRFEDHGGRDVALRYDLTVPLARVVAQYPDLPKPFKRYQVGPVWRADNAQRGRYREFYQFDMDIVGSDSMVADAEILVLMQQSLLALGLKDFVIRINDRRYLDRVAQLTELNFEQDALFKAVLDKRGKISDEQIQAEWSTLLTPDQVTAISAYTLGDDNAAQATVWQNTEFAIDPTQQTLGLAKQLGLQEPYFKIDRSIIRGLDYYSGIVFETTLAQAPEYGSVFSGGRYDGLIGRFAKQPMPAVGASIGVDRLIAALEDLNLLPSGPTGAGVYVTVFSPELQQISLQTVATLHQAGIRAEIAYETGQLGKQLKAAVNQRNTWAVIIGPDEAEQDLLTLRNLDSGQEQKLSLDQLVSQLTDSL
jgi:histidyl-tRNA synthetase